MILSENHALMQKLFRQFAEAEFTPALLDRLGNWNLDRIK